MLTMSVRTSAPIWRAAISRCTLARRSRRKRAKSTTESPRADYDCAPNGQQSGASMRHAAILAFTALLACGPVDAEPIALVADRVIDGVGKSPRDHTVVVTDGDRIVGVGDRSIIPAGAKVIELAGMTLMPGFINCHEHPLMFADDYQNAHLQASSAYKALMRLAALQKMLLAGWTGVRVMGDADVFYANQDIRKAIDGGVFVGPRVSGAGHYLSITGGGGDINYVSPEQHVIADGLVADGPEEIRKAVRQEIKYGSDWI